MRLDKWAVTAQEALQAAVGIATDANAGQLMPVHVLKALLSSGEHNLRAIIERVGADPASIEAQVDDAIARQPRVSGDTAQMGMADATVRVGNAAEKLATKMGDSYVTSEHLLCALADDKTDAGSILKAAGVTSKRVEEAYKNQEWWAKAALLNTACSGKFSSDRTIQQYVDEIWHLDKVVIGK